MDGGYYEIVEMVEMRFTDASTRPERFYYSTTMTSPMTPSASQNIPLKRKADEHVKDNVEKRRAVVLDVAKRRIAFKQTPLSLETARRSEFDQGPVTDNRSCRV